MYVCKNLNDTTPTKTINSRHINRLNFFSSLHPTKRDQLLKRLTTKEAIEACADEHAADIERIFTMGKFPELLFSVGLHCCRDILYSMGYKQSTKSALSNDVIQGGYANENIILITGCQNHEISNARVHAAAHLIRNLHRDVEIVFSGYSPKRDSVAIPIESVDMQYKFENACEELSFSEDEQARIKRMFCEQESTTTEENIMRFFEGNFLSDSRTYNLFVVSSTFHLIKLAKVLEAYLKTRKYRVAQIILCGAEDNDPLFTLDSGEVYIKAMYYEIYYYIIQQEVLAYRNKGGSSQHMPSSVSLTML